MSFQYSPTGFYKTPVSKGLLGCMFLTSCALNVPLLAHLKKYFAWTYPDVFIRYEIWRLAVSKTTFLDTKDLICGSLLIYYFRIFERRYGSHKYASYLLATTVVTTAIELMVSAMLHYLEMDEMPILHQSGSYGFIFPLFVSYFFDIPRVAQTTILGIPVTGKTLTYLLGLQMVSCSKTSAISGACGLLAGLVYRYNVLKIQSLVFVPRVVARLGNAVFGWVLQSSPPQDGIVPMGATIEIQRQQQLEALEQQILLNHAREMRHMATPSNQEQFMADYGGGGGARMFANHNEYAYQEAYQEAYVSGGLRHRAGGPTVDGNEAEVPGPSVREEQVQQLVEMGFDRQSVLEALRTSNYDINIATNMLLQES